MAALDFTQSNIRAWSLLRKLGGATHSKRQQPKVTANKIAHQLLIKGSVKKDRKQPKNILKQQREALSDCPETSNLSQAFTTDEIINALKTTNAGKAAGPDGIFPDMLKNIQWRIQGGFLVARKPPPSCFFFKSTLMTPLPAPTLTSPLNL